MNEEELRDCFAMFITCGLVMKYDKVDPEEIWRMADAMLETRKPKDETGIVAIKPKRRKE
jgi:hypothetical protein